MWLLIWLVAPALLWLGCKDMGRVSLWVLQHPQPVKRQCWAQGTICLQLLCTGAGDHPKSNPPECPALPTVCSSHVTAGRETWASLLSLSQTRTLSHRHAHSCPVRAGVHRLCPGVHGQPGSQLLPPDTARISTWGMADSSGPR